MNFYKVVCATEIRSACVVFPCAAVLYGLDTLTVVGIAFAAFVIGALLTGALWFIYSRTGTDGASAGRDPCVGEGRARGPAVLILGFFVFLLSLLTQEFSSSSSHEPLLHIS